MISASGTNSNLKELFIQISKLSQNLGWRFGGQ
jgi:hypothetical protein